MAVIRDHFTQMGLGLHNDLQNEHSIVGNFPFVNMFEHFGTAEQQEEFILGGFERRRRVAFGLTEPDHGSDATHMETARCAKPAMAWRAGGSTARRCGSPACTSPRIARHSAGPAARPAMPRASPACWCRRDPGMVVDEYLWTFNMPTDHPRIISKCAGCRSPQCSARSMAACDCAKLRPPEPHPPGRQLAGRGDYCVERSVKYARERKPFGRAGAQPGDPVPAGRAGDAVRNAAPADLQDRLGNGPDAHKEMEKKLSDKISMCNYYATGWSARRPTGPCRSTAASAIRATSRSSTSIATTAAIASPKARKKSRCARSAPICSAILGRASARRLAVLSVHRRGPAGQWRLGGSGLRAWPKHRRCPPDSIRTVPADG
jgi:acyl-CoA dehydrogenase